jgi:hypothetical protein
MWKRSDPDSGSDLSKELRMRPDPALDPQHCLWEVEIYFAPLGSLLICLYEGSDEDEDDDDGGDNEKDDQPIEEDDEQNDEGDEQNDEDDEQNDEDEEQNDEDEGWSPLDQEWGVFSFSLQMPNAILLIFMNTGTAMAEEVIFTDIYIFFVIWTQVVHGSCMMPVDHFPPFLSKARDTGDYAINWKSKVRNVKESFKYANLLRGTDTVAWIGCSILSLFFSSIR